MSSRNGFMLVKSPNNTLQPTAMSPLRTSIASLAALGAADRGRYVDKTADGSYSADAGSYNCEPK